MLQTVFPIDTRCHGTKFGTNLCLCTRYLRDFCVYRGIFGDEPLNAANRIFAHRPALPPRCHGNEIWDKMGNNSACIGDFCEIFAPRPIGRWGFRGWAIKCCQLHFSLIDPRCHANEIWDKIGYNSACVKNICEIFAPIRRGVSRMGHWMLPITFHPPTPLPWQRNLGQNWL